MIGDPYKGAQQTIVTASDGSRFEQWINPAAFSQPAPGTFGNSGRNSLRGLSFANVDFSVIKSTPITERVRTQFRVATRRPATNSAPELSAGSPIRLAITTALPASVPASRSMFNWR